MELSVFNIDFQLKKVAALKIKICGLIFGKITHKISINPNVSSLFTKYAEENAMIYPV